MSKGSKTNNVDYEINKSLDELVSEDQQLSRHHKGGAGHSKGHFNNYGGSRSAFNENEQGGGRYRANTGRGYGGAGRNANGDEREYRSGGVKHHEERGGSYRGDRRGGGAVGRGSRNFRSDEGEMMVEQRDAYGKNVQGRRLFVSNLAYETQWKYLKDHMRQAGDVVRADIFEKKDGTSRGIGVVEFRSKQDAQRALENLNQTELDGRKLQLKEDTEGHIFPPLQSKKDQIYQNPTATEYAGSGRGQYSGGYRGGREDHYQASGRGRGGNHHANQSSSFRERGVRRSRSRSRSESPRGSSSFQQQARPQRERQNSANASDGGAAAEGETAASRQRLTIQKRQQRPRASSSEGGSQTFSIHISNLPYSVDRNQLREAFKEFGKILHASVSLDERGQSRGFGIIEYETKEAALSAAHSMDKASFNGREVIVKYYEA